MKQLKKIGRERKEAILQGSNSFVDFLVTKNLFMLSHKGRFISMCSSLQTIKVLGQKCGTIIILIYFCFPSRSLVFGSQYILLKRHVKMCQNILLKPEPLMCASSLLNFMHFIDYLPLSTVQILAVSLPMTLHAMSHHTICTMLVNPCLLFFPLNPSLIKHKPFRKGARHLISYKPGLPEYEFTYSEPTCTVP